MIFTINGPSDSISTTIRIKDIVRLESCSLGFFDKKVFNLYIIVKAGAEEHFHLFTYQKKSDFQLAYNKVQQSLDKKTTQVEEIQIQPLR